MYTVAIITQAGPGFPRVCEGSHISENPSASTIPVDIPQEVGAVVVFDARLECQNPAVMDAGGEGILLLY
jgi:hypothetical protein